MPGKDALNVLDWSLRKKTALTLLTTAMTMLSMQWQATI